MIDKLKSMAIFAEVAQIGSFRAAAKAHGVSPSVISRHITLLEDDLGEVLINRSTRKLALTSIGKQFLIHCDDMLAAADKGVRSVKSNVEYGDLSVTLPIALAIPEFGKVIERFRAENPFVNFNFIFEDRYMDINETGVDIALRLGELDDSSLKSKRIATFNRSVLCTPDYLEAIGEIKTPVDLNKCTWIGRQNPTVAPILHSAAGEVHVIPAQPNYFRTNSVEAIKMLVMTNNGVSIFPDVMVSKELAEGSIIRPLSDWQAESLYLHALWSAKKTTGQLVKKFVDYLASELRAF